MQKIDLRQRYNLDDFPPDVARLIEKCGGIYKAEIYAAIANGTFGKLRDNKREYTIEMKDRVVAALNSNKPIRKDAKMTSQPLTVPDKCPPILAELIRFKGTKAAAWKELGTSEGTFYKVINGGEMPAAWIVRAKTAMGQSVIGAPAAAPIAPAAPAPDIPEFVPWDGKTKGVVITKAWGKAAARKIKNVPQPLVDLVAKADGIVSAAAKMLGMTGGALFTWLEGVREFTLERQKRVHAALHGLPPMGGSSNSMGEEFDRYTLGIAICMMKGAAFDRIAEIAEILMAKMVFRKNTKGGWIIIYRMADEDLPKFKRLAQRDAEEIVCP